MTGSGPINRDWSWGGRLQRASSLKVEVLRPGRDDFEPCDWKDVRVAIRSRKALARLKAGSIEVSEHGARYRLAKP